MNNIKWECYLPCLCPMNFGLNWRTHCCARHRNGQIPDGQDIQHHWSSHLPTVHSQSIWACSMDEGLKNDVRQSNNLESCSLLTHSNMIYLGGISLGIVVVECCFGNTNSSMDGRIESASIQNTIGEGLIDVIHHRDDHCKVGCSAWEVECGILEYLCTNMSQPEQCACSMVLALRTLHNCLTSCQLLESSSYSSSPNFLLSIIASSAFSYSNANSSISHTEFHCVETTHGIIWISISRLIKICFHAGNKIVVEFKILYASFQSCWRHY